MSWLAFVISKTGIYITRQSSVYNFLKIRTDRPIFQIALFFEYIVIVVLFLNNVYQSQIAADYYFKSDILINSFCF